MQPFARDLAILNLTASKKMSSCPAARLSRSRTLLPRVYAYASLAYALLPVFIAPATVIAQQQEAGLSINNNLLPNAPLPQTGAVDGYGQPSQAEGAASVSGTVLDATGAAISGARVSLTGTNGKTLRALVSGASGGFAFTGLAAGSYVVMVAAKGFAPHTSGALTLDAQQSYVMPDISLAVGGGVTQVTVLPTDVIAARQIKAEEKQRLLGIVPNFYVSYAHNPASMTTKQKFSLAAHDTFDWTSFVGISVTAAIEQANNTFAGYGAGAAGYGKRWAAKFGDGRTSDFFGHAVFPSIFHQDPRYFYQGTGTKESRLMHALEHPFIARGDSGQNMPNYSFLLGDMVSGALSNTYYPHADRGANLVFTNSLVGLAGLAGATVLQEFIGKRLTKNASRSSEQDPALALQPVSYQHSPAAVHSQPPHGDEGETDHGRRLFQP